MSAEDIYRSRASYALSQAELAEDEHDRATWIWVAKGWLNLLPGQYSPEGAFEAAVDAQWTGQDPSEALH